MRQYQRVTQELTDPDRVLTRAGGARAALPGDASDMERRVHRAVKDTASRSKRELEVTGAQVAGKPFIPRRTGAGGYVTAGSELMGAQGIHWYNRRGGQPRQPRRRGGGGA